MAFNLQKLSGLVKRPKKKNNIPKLVIGINQVDNLGPWNDNTNLPTAETMAIINERVNDIVNKLSEGHHSASREQIEYYSALRAYRLPMLINKIAHCSGIITTFNPKDITDPEVALNMPKENRDEINKIMAEGRKGLEEAGMDAFMAKLLEALTPEEGKEMRRLYEEKKHTPVRVGILGQSGVGKTTTVNNLFGAKFKTSRTVEGTKDAQYKDFELENGSIITIVDLPGYGRSVQADEKYQEIYIRELKKCDVILLIIQANDKANLDDVAMVQCLYEWSKEGLLTNEDKYYGQLNEADCSESNENRIDEKERAKQKSVDIENENVGHPSDSSEQKLTDIRKFCLKEMANFSDNINSDTYKVLNSIFQITNR